MAVYFDLLCTRQELESLLYISYPKKGSSSISPIKEPNTDISFISDLSIVRLLFQKQDIQKRMQKVKSTFLVVSR